MTTEQRLGHLIGAQNQAHTCSLFHPNRSVRSYNKKIVKLLAVEIAAEMKNLPPVDCDLDEDELLRELMA